MTSRNPFSRARAIGSKWTALHPTDREKHYEVVALRADAVELRCILNGRVRTVLIETLRNPELWKQGWRQ